MRTLAIGALLAASAGVAGCYAREEEPAAGAPEGSGVGDPGVDVGTDEPAAEPESCHEGVDWSGFVGCDAIRTESHYCLAFGGGQLRLLALDSHVHGVRGGADR